MPARCCRLALACTLAGLLVAPCRAGVRPTVFISADKPLGGADPGDVTYTFHMSEVPGGTAACTGTPTHASEAGTMTAALTLSEEASLEPHYYVGWTIKITGGGGAGGTGTIATYDPLTRVITAAGVASTAAASTYELTAGTCAAQFAARGGGTCAETETTSPVPVDTAACLAVTALLDNVACVAVPLSASGSGVACTYTPSTGEPIPKMWSNCPAGCDFAGPIVNPGGFHKFVSGPLPCTTVAFPAGSKATLLCPLNTVAAAEQPLTDISIRRQTIQTTAAMAAAAVGQSFEIRDTVVAGTMTAALTLAAGASATDAYYAGWRIETEFPKASGTVLTYTGASKVITVAWDEPTACDTGFDKDKTTCTPVTTTAATTYTLTADCDAAPKNVPLVVQAKADAGAPFTYQFVPGSLTSWAPTATPFAKCTVHRSVDGLYSAHVPAGAFTDAGGNPNTASTSCRDFSSAVVTAYGDGADAATVVETAAGAALCNVATPYQVTSDVTAPTVTVTASDDNWMSSVASAGTANGDRVTFKFVLSEPPIKTTVAAAFALPGGAVADGDVTTAHKCANPASWGTVSQQLTA